MGVLAVRRVACVGAMAGMASMRVTPVSSVANVHIAVSVTAGVSPSVAVTAVGKPAECHNAKSHRSSRE